MYNISQNPIGSRQCESNTNTTEDSVENIIRKYTQAGTKKNVRSNDNIYATQYPSTLPNYQSAKELRQAQIQSAYKNSIVDHNLCDFIKKICKEEVHKEIQSKLSEKYMQDSLLNTIFDNQTEPSPSQKECSDKTTYCRPVLDLYNHNFICKTIEKNVKLTRLAKKLVAAHHIHTQNEAWNNFINELKNKHAHNKVQRRYISNISAMPVERSTLRYDSNFSQSKNDNCSAEYLCRHLNANDNCYTEFNESQVNEMDNRHQTHNRTKYGRDEFCYSSMSLERCTVLQKEKENLSHINILGNHSTNNVITVKEDFATTKQNNQNCRYNQPLQLNYNSEFSKSLRDTPIQTNHNEFLFTDSNKKKDCATEIRQDLNEYKRCTISMDTSTSKQSVELSRSAIKEVSLRHIEDKLETIIDSINNLMKELKAKKKSRNRHNACINLICKECHNVKTELVKKYNDDIIFDGEKYNSSDSVIPVNDINSSLEQYSNNSDITKLNQIFSKQLGDEGRLNRNKACAVQIAFEVPTRERSTEITKSLSQTWKILEDNVEEIVVPVTDENLHNNMTIAVNTDPLSFLALLRISTEAMKRLLSYVPNFDYYYYLSRLQFPQLPKSIDRQFICNICGARFKKPSYLNDHIQDHDLGETKNCCVCRQVLERLGRTSCLFSCRYCGQCFTRAYCCELHQETCAKRLGKVHDVPSDLLLLR